jgi:hypothetical protein
MFGRRSVRRSRRQGRLIGAHHSVLRALRRAHAHMAAGEYGQAFPILKRLADGAAERGMPVRAANLAMQAARARLEMGSAGDAVALARTAIQLLRSSGHEDQARRLVPRMVEALRERGYHDEAVDLQAETAALLGGDLAPTGQPRGALPLRCPSCNGPVRGDEVVWIDDRSAECPYCGSMIPVP